MVANLIENYSGIVNIQTLKHFFLHKASIIFARLVADFYNEKRIMSPSANYFLQNFFSAITVESDYEKVQENSIYPGNE